MHVMTPKSRSYYDLDTFWGNGTPVPLEGVLTPNVVATEEAVVEDVVRAMSYCITCFPLFFCYIPHLFGAIDPLLHKGKIIPCLAPFFLCAVCVFFTLELYLASPTFVGLRIVHTHAVTLFATEEKLRMCLNGFEP